MTTNMTGSCQCGGVRYQISGQPLLTYACHCRDCQKRAGSFSIGMLVPADCFTIQGELKPWTRTSDQGNSNTRYACAQCGNNIYGAGSNMPTLYKVHLWVSRKQPWVIIPQGAAQFETQPENPAAMLVGLKSNHPA